MRNLQIAYLQGAKTPRGKLNLGSHLHIGGDSNTKPIVLKFPLLFYLNDIVDISKAWNNTVCVIEMLNLYF